MDCRRSARSQPARGRPSSSRICLASSVRLTLSMMAPHGQVESAYILSSPVWSTKRASEQTATRRKEKKVRSTLTKTGSNSAWRSAGGMSSEMPQPNRLQVRDRGLCNLPIWRMPQRRWRVQPDTKHLRLQLSLRQLRLRPLRWGSPRHRPPNGRSIAADSPAFRGPSHGFLMRPPGRSPRCPRR